MSSPVVPAKAEVVTTHAADTRGVTNQELAQAAAVYARVLHADVVRALAGDFGALLTAGTVAAHLTAITPQALLAVAWMAACRPKQP